MSQQQNFSPRFLMPPPAYPPPNPMFRVPFPPGPRVRGFSYRPRGTRHFFHRPPSQESIMRKVHKNQTKKELKKKRKAEFKGVASSVSVVPVGEEAASVVAKNQRVRPEWCRKDAERALTFEKEYNASTKTRQIKIEFPDIQLDQEELRCLHPNIRKVMVNTPFVRHCFVTVKPDADLTQVLADLNSKPLPEFNGQCARASLVEDKVEEVSPENIDPLSLYIGNIPLSVKPKFLTDLFPNRARMDIGRALKIKKTRYAFVSFNTLKDTIEAFKTVINLKLDDQNLIVRFKRIRASQTRGINAASTCKEDEEFHYIPKDRSQGSVTSTSDSGDWSDAGSDIWYDPEEYDLAELHPAPRPPSLAVMRFLSSNDENETHFRDYDAVRNVTILPEDVFSVRTTDSLLDLDTPYS